MYLSNVFKCKHVLHQGQNTSKVLFFSRIIEYYHCSTLKIVEAYLCQYCAYARTHTHRVTGGGLCSSLSLSMEAVFDYDTTSDQCPSLVNRALKYTSSRCYQGRPRDIPCDTRFSNPKFWWRMHVTDTSISPPSTRCTFLRSCRFVKPNVERGVGIMITCAVLHA